MFSFDDEKNNKRTLTTAKKRNYIDDIGGKCQVCNQKFKSRHLDIHHIKHIAKGGSDRISNIIALCPTCHRKAHSNDLSAKVLRDIKTKTVNSNVKRGTLAKNKPKTKKELLQSLTLPKLKKVAKKIDIEVESDGFFSDPNKKDYVEDLTKSRKATVANITKILDKTKTVKSSVKKGAVAKSKPKTKKELLQSLTLPKLKKIAKKLDIEVESYSFFSDPDKDDYISDLTKSRKVTVAKIVKILDI